MRLNTSSRRSNPVLTSAIAAMLIAIAITVQAAELNDQEFEKVMDLQSFTSRLIGPKIADPANAENFFVIHEDGTLEGLWFGKKLTGNWRWEESYFCRTLSAPRPAPEDCQEWWIAKEQVKLVRNRGSGEETLYSLWD